jgi:cytochrome c55X
MFSLLTLTARCVSLALILGGVTLFSVAACADEKIKQTRQRELVQLVRNDCGSCHGMTLKGGLGPALLPDSLRDKAPEGLRETILRGRTGTAMPPWSAFISEEEANWIVEQLMKGFPDAH